MQQISINGQKYIISKKVKISELIAYLTPTRQLFVLELNNSICNKNMWRTTVVEENDKLEIITIVGGG